MAAGKANHKPGFEVGAARHDITCLVPGIGMMGWAMWHNRAQRVQLPLQARAFVFNNPQTGQRLFVCHLEICFVSLAIRQGVLHQLQAHHPSLGVTEHNLLLMANHTHSGAGGYSHYALFNITIPGFCPQVLEAIVSGAAHALVEAFRNLAPASVYVAGGAFADDVPVAFNRAWEAHNENQDVNEKFDFAHRHLAVDREMVLLRLEGEAGRKIGLVNWFAVHATSVHSDKDGICPDNKGWAALQVEAFIRDRQPGTDFVAGFAQACAGDVSPNFRYHKGKKEMRGTSPDDFEAMQANGDFQAEKAKEIFKKATLNREEPPVLDSILAYVDMSQVEVDPAFAAGRHGCRTGKAMLGVGFLNGTREGEGVHGFLPWACATLANLRGMHKTERYAEIHGPKQAVMNLADRIVMGYSVNQIPVSGRLAPEIAVLKRWARANAFGQQPLAPNILPVQIVVIGSLAVAALPGEPTTQAGRRIRAALEPILAHRGVARVVVAGYANAYAGYITTQEEYRLQGYEGASTHFGQWTCAAYQTVLQALAHQLLLPPASRNLPHQPQPHLFSEAELLGRSFLAPI